MKPMNLNWVKKTSSFWTCRPASWTRHTRDEVTGTLRTKARPSSLRQKWFNQAVCLEHLLCQYSTFMFTISCSQVSSTNIWLIKIVMMSNKAMTKVMTLSKINKKQKEIFANLTITEFSCLRNGYSNKMHKIIMFIFYLMLPMEQKELILKGKIKLMHLKAAS